MKNGINRVTSSANIIEGGTGGVCLIGDPGCDGLGAATMSVFAKALTYKPAAGSSADVHIVLGDLVPFGLEQLYKNVEDVINAVADTPVFALCGNHDTDFYDSYFGLRNYTLTIGGGKAGGGTLVVVLDNAKRKFSDEALALCESALRESDEKNIVILFHIPPPNGVTGNSLSEENWMPFRDIYLPHKKRIKYFACGHVHAYFEDVVDGIPLIVTGGGGARIEYVNDALDREKQGHHVVSLRMESPETLLHSRAPLDEAVYDAELKDAKLVEMLESSLSGEMKAHFKYKLMAEEARDNPALSKLFAALSDSEYRHAKNHFFVLNKFEGVGRALSDSIEGERYEINVMYKDYMEYADRTGAGLTKYTFFDAIEAEKVHEKLLSAAAAGKADPHISYYTCTSCGYTFAVDKHPQRCPVCGAPQDKIAAVL